MHHKYLFCFLITIEYKLYFTGGHDGRNGTFIIVISSIVGGGVVIVIIGGGICLLVIILVKKTKTSPNGMCILYS